MNEVMSGATILVIDDEVVQREALSGHLRKAGHEVLEAADGRAGVDVLRGNLVDLVVTDYRMPELDGMGVLREARDMNPHVEVVMVTAYGTVAGAVDALREGACHYLEKPLDLDDLDRVLTEALERRRQSSENQVVREEMERLTGLKDFVATDPAMERALSIVARAAPSRASVLIRGESGTGKELVARALHALSPRREGPFVAVNCAALNESVIESELFGHEKGAFTGAAQQRPGRFEQAHGGTLFIDELAEIPATVQVKLLRVLQEREFERVGSSSPIPVDVRIISATHRNLTQAVSAGAFREDLYYRLNVVTVELPPLRMRRSDIAPLAEHFLARFADENGKHIGAISKEAADLLLRYDFPGNVRELQNMLERAVVMARGPLITREDLPPELQLGAEVTADSAEELPLPERVKQLEREAIAEALEQAGGVQSRAAELLGISERNLRYKLDKYGMR